jgi:hypothetical protein
MSDVTEYGPAYGLRAARVLHVVAGVIVKTELFYPRVAAADPQITTIVFEGGDTSQIIDDETRLDLTLTCDKLNLMQRQAIFGKTRVATPSSGMAWGVYYGDAAEVAGVAAGLEIDVVFKDESTFPPTTGQLRRVFPVGVLKTVRPQQMEYAAKLVDVLNFSFSRTALNLLGAALTSVPSGGAFYLEGELT